MSWSRILRLKHSPKCQLYDTDPNDLPKHNYMYFTETIQTKEHTVALQYVLKASQH